LTDRAVNAAAKTLRRLFAARGVLRVPDLERRRSEGRKYHKGYEVRFVLDNEPEMHEVIRLLRLVGIRHGAPYGKRTQFVVPVYGRESVLWFLPDARSAD
jgi:hypothetical protein